MLVYLDNCCFNRPFDNQTPVRVRLETEAKLAIQNEIRGGLLKLAWSYILDFENEANPSEGRRESIRRWRQYASTDTSEVPAIVNRAIGLHRSGLKKMDSLHVAAAIEMKCDVFLTTDDGVLKRRGVIQGIRILNPLEYYADYNDRF